MKTFQPNYSVREIGHQGQFDSKSHNCKKTQPTTFFEDENENRSATGLGTRYLLICAENRPVLLKLIPYLQMKSNNAYFNVMIMHWKEVLHAVSCCCKTTWEGPKCEVCHNYMSKTFRWSSLATVHHDTSTMRRETGKPWCKREPKMILIQDEKLGVQKISRMAFLWY